MISKAAFCYSAVPFRTVLVLIIFTEWYFTFTAQYNTEDIRVDLYIKNLTRRQYSRLFWSAYCSALVTAVAGSIMFQGCPLVCLSHSCESSMSGTPGISSDLVHYDWMMNWTGHCDLTKHFNITMFYRNIFFFLTLFDLLTQEQKQRLWPYFTFGLILNRWH